MEIIQSTFHPTCDMTGKSNYKPYYRIERDGTVFERICLDVPDISVREELICKHYLKNYAKVFLQDTVGVKIISSDDPWDFKIELSTKEVFNVEITSIAEDSELFEKLKREERLITKSKEETLPLHELEKLNGFFPNSEIEGLIKKYKDSGISKKDLVENPYKDRNPNIFLSSRTYDKEPLSNLIRKAIESKEVKKHFGKDNTVLIIDNRTLTYEYPDLNLALNSLEDHYKSSSFKEIWFYTGYCSDINGNNAEFSLAPLKIPKDQEEILNKMKKNNPPDNKGTIYI